MHKKYWTQYIQILITVISAWWDYLSFSSTCFFHIFQSFYEESVLRYGSIKTCYLKRKCYFWEYRKFSLAMHYHPQTLRLQKGITYLAVFLNLSVFNIRHLEGTQRNEAFRPRSCRKCVVSKINKARVYVKSQGQVVTSSILLP